MPPRDPKDLLSDDDKKAAEQAKQEFEALKTKMTTLEGQLSQSSEEMALLKTRAEDAEKRLEESKRRPATPPGSRTVEEEEADFAERVKEGIYTHPTQALDEHFRRRMGPVLVSHYEQQATMARDLALDKLPPADRKAYEKEIDDLMGKVDLPTRANPKAWQQAYKMVRADKMDDIIKKEITEVEERLTKKFGGGAPPAEGATPPPGEGGPKKVELTAEQKTVAERYVKDGVFKNVEEYVEWSKR